jgi:peptidoglycan biosynthesis protein MviN/MurJ (putative lipid II flippase)
VRVELADLVSNAAALTVLVHALPRFGIEVAAWVTVMRPAAAMLLLLPSAGRPVRPWFGSPVLRIGAQRLRPIVLGSLYSKSGSVLDRWLASWTGIGTLSLLHFAERLYGAALDVFRRSLVSPSIPPLSEHVRRGEWQAYRALCLRRLGMTALACLLVYAGTGVGGRHLLGSLIGHGGLTSGNMQLLWTLLMLMGGYLLGGALNHVLAQALYVQGDAATPAKIGVIAFTVGASLKLAGVVAWGVQGIALASGAQYLFGLVLFWVAWRRSLARTAGRKTFPAEAMR